MPFRMRMEINVFTMTIKSTTVAILRNQPGLIIEVTLFTA